MFVVFDTHMNIIVSMKNNCKQYVKHKVIQQRLKQHGATAKTRFVKQSNLL